MHKECNSLWLEWGLYFQRVSFVVRREKSFLFLRLHKILRPIYFLLLLILSASSSVAQTTVNIATGTLSFLQANRVSIIGDGTKAGDKILYTNVITLNGQQIDCIVTTVSLSSGTTFALPAGLSSPQTPHDVAATSSTNYSSNADAYFSPTFNMTSSTGGSCRFLFQFVVGGSYNASSNPTGTPIILENLRLSTYDLDGNGTINSNQYTEFGGFSSYTLGNPTAVVPSYNAVSGLTSFRSNTSSNNSVVTDSRYRATVDYSSVSEIDILVGTGASGVSYFFFDFSAGVAWSPTTTTTTVYTPNLDLNTETAGLDNSVSDCYAVQSMTYGGTNLTGVSSGFINEIIIEFNSSDIKDGSSEVMWFEGATGITQSTPLLLNFSDAGTQSFSFGGNNYSLARSVSAGVGVLKITRTSTGGWETAEAESMLDAVRYANTADPKNSGTRTFKVVVREGTLLTPQAQFIVQIPCTLLRFKWIDFNIKKIEGDKIRLQWVVMGSADSKGFHVEVSLDGVNWLKQGHVSATGNADEENRYDYELMVNPKLQAYIRVRHTAFNDKYSFSSIKLFSPSSTLPVQVWPNPFNQQLNISTTQSFFGRLMIVDSQGKTVWKEIFSEKTKSIQASHWTPGRYTVLMLDKNGALINIPVIKQ